MNTAPLMHKNLAFIGTFFALFFVFSFSVGSFVAHAATLTRQLDIGSTGQDVTSLQSYLSGYAAWYPSALVTGYFGALTQAGVEKFQTAKGIVSSGTPATTGYGRVGPSTLARLNVEMNGTTGADTSMTVPVLSPLTVQRGQTAITFSWTTNEPTIGQVYWSTGGIQSDEATGPNQTPYVSGNLALDVSGLQTSHSVTIQNLQPNTIYYYFVRSIDVSGDMSVMLTSSVQTTL